MLMITDVFQTYSNIYCCFWMQAMQVQFSHGMLVADMWKKSKLGADLFNVIAILECWMFNSLNDIVAALFVLQMAEW